jgi:hypothetical protein
MNKEPQSGGWWRTIPGMLTAAAGIITAVTGLIVALHQAGVFDGEKQKAPRVQNEAIKPPKVSGNPAPPAPDATKPSSTSQVAPSSVNLSAGTQVRVGDLVYTVLATRLERYAPNKLSLTFEVRMTNNGRYPANFWASSFRLLLDGVPRAPENDLNEVVKDHSANEGIVEFVIQDTTTAVGIQIGDVGKEAPTISLDLQGVKP